jgi:hypothetical protein
MLSTYASLESMDPARRPRCNDEPRCSHLQMEGLQRGNPLFGSSGSRCRKDIHTGEFFRAAGGCVRPHPAPRQPTAERPKRWTVAWLHRVLHRFACSRSDILWRRTHHRESDAEPRTRSESRPYLASQRCTTRGSGRCHSIRSAAPGSRRLRDRCDHYRPRYGRIAQHRKRDLLRTAALRLVAPPQEALEFLRSQPDVPFGR